MKSTVLLVTEEFDPTADALIGCLRRRAHPYLRWNLDRFPLQSALTMRMIDGQLQGSIQTDGRSVDLREIGSAWFRSLRAGGFPSDLGPQELQFAQAEVRCALQGLANITRWRWINRPQLDRIASCKPTQLAVAGRLGLHVPRTLISNDPDEVRAFYETCQGQIIYKAFTQMPELSPGQAIFTSKVTSQHLASLEMIRHTPGIFQEYVPKAFELRVTIVDGVAFPVEIHSQEIEETAQDWRVAPDRVRHRPHKLPADLEAKLLDFMGHFGLVYSAMDLIVTPDGRYVFLENNPSGQYGWIEAETGLPITDRLAETLTAAKEPCPDANETYAATSHGLATKNRAPIHVSSALLSAQP